MKERVKFEGDMSAIWEQVAARVAEFEEGYDTEEHGAIVPIKIGELRDKIDVAKHEIERMEAADDDSWNDRCKAVAALLEELVAEMQDLETHLP